ncbi:hypothetical protein WMY93_007468 [Mugilogobius chulae]|uniref:Uncharacterized protein n=1 Tax=Mugilogobius chulae TaxID=88201 RepID=A0AAW0PD35_9GOBI
METTITRQDHGQRHKLRVTGLRKESTTSLRTAARGTESFYPEPEEQESEKCRRQESCLRTKHNLANIAKIRELSKDQDKLSTMSKTRELSKNQEQPLHHVQDQITV